MCTSVQSKNAWEDGGGGGGGVNQSNQILTLYEAEHKRLKKWYKKYFLYLVNISTFNAHVIAKSNGYRKSTHTIF